MKKLKTAWGSKGFRVSSVTSVAVIILVVVVTLVATLNTFLFETLCAVLGQPIANKGGMGGMEYTCDYDNKKDVLKAANDFSVRAEKEGAVLLKNDHSLPLKSNAKVTVFGKNSVNLVLGGSGSSAGSTGGVVGDLYSSLQNAGISYNPTMKNFYESNNSGTGRPKSPTFGDIIYGFGTGETPVSSYGNTQKSSYSDYNDAAIVVISRIGGEGYDLPRTMRSGAAANSPAVAGARSATDHYLQLDKNETDMLNEACKNFDNVIVVLNTSAPMELGFLDDPTHYAYHENIKGALFIGLPGNAGIMALGEILSGKTNPSGHLADTYVRDFKEDPTWANFGNHNVAESNSYLVNGSPSGYYFVDYEEGIYVGYRYYETRGYTDGESWYKNNVVYPFGYGLSYTSFDWEFVSEGSTENQAQMKKDGKYTYRVKVTNTGDCAGMDVVQLYVSAPYTAGGIEKSYLNLAGFAKTKLLAKGESDIVTVEFNAFDLASYDYNDANANGFKGYELEKGDYVISLRKDAHTPSNLSDLTLKVNDGLRFENDPVTGAKIENLFDDVSSGITTYLSRNDWTGTWPKTPTEEERNKTEEWISSLKYTLKDETSDPWYTTTMPVQAETEVEIAETKFAAVLGKDYDDPIWDKLLDQLTLAQLRKIVALGNYQTTAVSQIVKPKTYDLDGPQGFAQFMGDPAVYDTCKYPDENIIACTWNVAIAEEMGIMLGNEGLIGNEKVDGVPYSGIYAPACNMHRSQFAGRNWEYYSEDGLLSAKMTAGVVKGARSKGLSTYVKHFALNDQETNRDSNGYLAWCNEQAMREIYYKPFEASVKDGHTTAMMSSFNRVGKTWTGGSYALLTRLLRDEWGFRGCIITDYANDSYMTCNEMVRAGGDLYLGQGNNYPSKTATATNISVIRQAAKNVLYMVSVSSAMDGISEDTVITYSMPIWERVVIGVDAGIIALCLAWNVWTFLSATKKEENK